VARILEVLRLDPGNAAAQTLLKNAAGRLYAVALEAYDVGMRQEARHYLDLALTVTPDVAEWRSLRDAWTAETSAVSEGGNS